MFGVLPNNSFVSILWVNFSVYRQPERPLVLQVEHIGFCWSQRNFLFLQKAHDFIGFRLFCAFFTVSSDGEALSCKLPRLLINNSLYQDHSMCFPLWLSILLPLLLQYHLAFVILSPCKPWVSPYCRAWKKRAARVLKQKDDLTEERHTRRWKFVFNPSDTFPCLTYWSWRLSRTQKSSSEKYAKNLL